MSDLDVDVVVIGAGPVGENVADRAHQQGLSAAIVEAGLVGGECSYYACIPSKALLRPVDLLAAAHRVPGVQAGPIDVAEVLARRDQFAAEDDSGQADWLSGAGITLLRGRGRLAGERAVEVAHDDGTTTSVAARYVVVASGSVPTYPPVDGIHDVGAWTNRDATQVKDVPSSLLILGGGVVGVEMATAYQRLGAQVTLVQHGERLLPNTEPEAGRRVQRALEADGVDVRLGTSMRAVRREGGEVVASLDDGSEVRGAELLVAAGRRSTTDDLGLETVGLEPGKPLPADDSTTVLGDWLYAVGDASTGAKLTHMGKYQARICGDVVVARAHGKELGGRYSHHATTAEHTAVPQVIFTDPQVAAVGHTEASARDAGLPVRAVSYEIGNTAGGSLQADGYDGFATLVVDTEREVIVGATFVGQDVADMVHGATIAIVGEVTVQRLWHAVPSFPTMSEVWLRLLEAYGM
ncbi:NAD(P)/FAD-dependent oxidoreductase [Actinomycetospora sp. TBRC 11914]|uniref:dihydrolipoyl dehydrogenase family protein n=1 Tax=Actinomycetospora sp. TBRC 11914 TaxID=2729387 RepID=UPI00145EEBA8|nr:NAD(P)/FAD-dependent oxidoreductase [Actinomycetospora sp. TBRC 11914]NMO92244.1 NAD(P)/FAD-dependent oxidoreductase [Actinomycetospora sp. TBRC 11914]